MPQASCPRHLAIGDVEHSKQRSENSGKHFGNASCKTICGRTPRRSLFESKREVGFRETTSSVYYQIQKRGKLVGIDGRFSKRVEIFTLGRHFKLFSCIFGGASLARILPPSHDCQALLKNCCTNSKFLSAQKEEECCWWLFKSCRRPRSSEGTAVAKRTEYILNVKKYIKHLIDWLLYMWAAELKRCRNALSSTGPPFSALKL